MTTEEMQLELESLRKIITVCVEQFRDKTGYVPEIGIETTEQQHKCGLLKNWHVSVYVQIKSSYES